MTALPTVDTHVAATSPYPWPWNGELAGPGSAAVVLVPRRGGPAVDPAVAANVAAVAAAVRAAGGAVLAVTTAAPGRRPAPDDSESGADLLARLGVDGADGADALLAADGVDGFSGSPLEGALRARRVERLVLVGAGLETCVHSTMRSANDRGFECLLVIDASAPYDPSLVPAAISMIEMSGGIFGAVALADEVVRAFTPTGDCS